MPRKFKYEMWDFDGDGLAYVIAVDECPEKQLVPEYIVKADGLHRDVLNPEFGYYLSADDVQEGWCKYQVRTDWFDGDGSPMGGYVVEVRPHMTTAHKGQRGWFPVWIIRVGDWY